MSDLELIGLRRRVSELEQELTYWKSLAKGDWVQAAKTKPTTFLEDVMEHDSK